MIDVIYFALGFIIYMLFNILTFDLYSKKKGITNSWALLSIFIYYSLLIIYIINVVDSESSLVIRIVEMVVYIVPGGAYMYNYYIKLLRNNNETSKYYRD